MLLCMCLLKKYLKLLFKTLHDFFPDVPIISLSRSLVFCSRMLFLAALPELWERRWKR